MFYANSFHDKSGKVVLSLLQLWRHPLPRFPSASKELSGPGEDVDKQQIFNVAQTRDENKVTQTRVTQVNGRKGWKIMTEDGESLDSNALRAVVGMIKEIEYQVAGWLVCSIFSVLMSISRSPRFFTSNA